MESVAIFLLWDVDHTLIENGGMSKATYRAAFANLIGQESVMQPETGGRTDVAIMSNLLAANGESADAHPWAQQFAALAMAGERNRALLIECGHALPGAADCLAALLAEPGVIQSVLTGNIEPNARVKLGVFGLDRWLDFEVGGFGEESGVRADLVPVAQRKAAALRDFDPVRDVTILIGDTPKDVEAGIDGHARVIGVATGGVPVADLLAAGADAAVEDLTDVDAFVQTVRRVAELGPVPPPQDVSAQG